MGMKQCVSRCRNKDETLSCSLSHKNRYQQVLLRPVRQVEEWQRLSADSCPFDAAQVMEVGCPEVERTPVEQDGPASFVNFPQASPVETPFVPCQQVFMQIDVSELQHAVLIDDEFLVHTYYINDDACKDTAFRTFPIKIPEKRQANAQDMKDCCNFTPN